MNGDTLSEADMENLRRRMAEARIFDVTEVYSLKCLLIAHDVRIKCYNVYKDIV